MEKINFLNSRGLNLVGNIYNNNNHSIIIMSHGFLGDRSEEGRFDKTVGLMYYAGLSVMTFDYSGSGESADDSLSIEKEVDDLSCAIRFIFDRKYKNIGLLGFSLGGLVALKAYKQFSENINTMVLWAPVTDKKNDYAKYKFTAEENAELDKRGFITIYKSKGIRKRIIVDKQMIIERESVNQNDLLKNIICPVLIIHGDSDKNVPLENSMNAIKILQLNSENAANSQLEIIQGENHFFAHNMDTVIKLTIDWYKKYLQI